MGLDLPSNGDRINVMSRAHHPHEPRGHNSVTLTCASIPHRASPGLFHNVCARLLDNTYRVERSEVEQSLISSIAEHSWRSVVC